MLSCQPGSVGIHLCVLEYAADAPDFLLKRICLLQTSGVPQHIHAPFHLADECIALTCQDVANGFYIAGVFPCLRFCGGGLQAAVSGAEADMGIQTLQVMLLFARTDGKQVPKHAERGLERHAVGKRPDEFPDGFFDAVAFVLMGHDELGELLIRDGDKEVLLIVTPVDVELRAVPLDQLGFEDEGFDVGRHFLPIQRSSGIYHSLDARVNRFCITRKATLQIRCLSYIYGSAPAISPGVYTWRGGGLLDASCQHWGFHGVLAYHRT